MRIALILALALSVSNWTQVTGKKSPDQFNSWKGFINSEGQEKPAKLRFIESSSNVATTLLLGFSCSVKPPEPPNLLLIFNCVNGDTMETIYAHLNYDNGIVRMSGKWKNTSFVFCPEYPDDNKRTDDCLGSISIGSSPDVSGTRESSTTLLYQPLNIQTSERISVALPKVESALTSLDSKGLHISSESHAAVEFMGEFYTRKGKAPDRYANTLESMAELLNRAADHPNDPQSQALVKDIQDNLQIMYESSKPTLASSSAETHRIVVKTEKSDKEVSGWEIFYMEYFFIHVKNEVGPDSFPRPSSPTEAELPPSRYVIQAVNTKTGAKSERKIITVHNQPEEFVIQIK